MVEFLLVKIAMPLSGISLRERSYRTHARSGEKYTPGSRCALPHRGPARRQPLLSGADPGIRTGSAKSIVMAHCYEQFCLAGWVVFCWDLRARLFGDFPASGTGRRRPDRHRDRMDTAEAARRRKTRRAQNRRAAGHIPPGILSLDDATDSRPWINLRGDHAGRERGSPSLVPSFDNFGRTHWIGVDRDQHFALLWICRPVGANPGSNGDDSDHAIVVVFPSLYRCADCLERAQSIAGVGDAAFWLTNRPFPLKLQRYLGWPGDVPGWGYLRNLYKALRTSFESVRYCSARRHRTVALTLIALAAICFFASVFFLYVLLQWMRETKRTTNALKKVVSKRVVLPTARRTGAQRGKK
jgi:hypothetical protein